MGSPAADLSSCIKEAIARDFQVITAITGHSESDELIQSMTEGVMIVPWRHASTLSAKAAVASAVEAVKADAGQLSGVIFVLNPPGENRGFHQIPPGELEKIIMEVFAGTLFVLRESLSALTQQGSGELTIILNEHNLEVLPPPAAGMLAGIQRTIEGMFRAYANEAIVIQGIRSSVREAEVLGAYVFEEYLGKSEKTAWRWTKFTGKTGLFGRK